MQYNNGIANTASGFALDSCTSATATRSVYTGGPATICGKMALLYRGYIFASLAGTYTFSIPTIDDAAWLWVGESAKQGWTTANAGIKTMVNSLAGPTTFTVPIEGTYIPYRIVMVNGGSGSDVGGASALKLTVANPYNVLIDIGAGSLNAVQYACPNDAAAGPQFAGNMGQEV